MAILADNPPLKSAVLNKLVEDFARENGLHRFNDTQKYKNAIRRVVVVVEVGMKTNENCENS